uniref:Odorant receptor n=1 Tax=Glossina brevipalpis TaxID=37001 RepID=A0A1A9X571_9MUSC
MFLALSRGVGIKAQSSQASAYLFNAINFLAQDFHRKWTVGLFVHSFVTNGFVVLFMPILFNLSYLHESRQFDFGQLFTSIQAAINICAIPIKFITMQLYMKNLHQINKMLNILDGRCKHPEELNKLRRCALTGNRIYVGAIIVYFSYSISTCMGFMLTGQAAYNIYIPGIDWRKSQLEFVIQGLIEFASMNLICLHQTVYDSYSGIYLYIIRMHIQILNERLARMGSDPQKNEDQHYEELIQCILDHKLILRLVSAISPMISCTIFVQFTITAAMLATTMINISFFSNVVGRIASIFYIILVFAQSSLCCYQATCLVTDADKLPVSIFHCHWIEHDYRFRKMIVYFMVNTQKSITFTAGKLFAVNMASVLSIAKCSFSFYALLKEMDFGGQATQ